MSSHAACDHPATKAARAACRRMRDAGMRGVRNSKTAQQLELGRSSRALERPDSLSDARLVNTVALTRDKLFAGIWVRLRASGSQQWQHGYLVSAMHDNIRVSLDSGEWVEYEWESGAYEIEQEVYELDSDSGSNLRMRTSTKGRRRYTAP